MEESEGILNTNAHWADGIESPEGSLYGVRNSSLPLRSKLHEDIIRPLLYSHDLRDPVPYLDNLREVGTVLKSERNLDFSIFENPSRGYLPERHNAVQLDAFVGVGIFHPPAR